MKTKDILKGLKRAEKLVQKDLDTYKNQCNLSEKEQEYVKKDELALKALKKVKDIVKKYRNLKIRAKSLEKDRKKAKKVITTEK